VTPLDNPMWAALTTGHAALAIAHGDARRYPYEIARFAGLATPGAIGDLEAITEPGDVVAFFTPDALALPDGWSAELQRTIEQMLATERVPEPRHELVALDTADAPEMLALATLTQPGPFFARTIETGRYFGVKVDGKLAAMAGERLKLDDFTEISAVCTHPDHQGHGYGRSLVAALINLTLDEGRQPFLHVKQENGARALYEKLGFTTRAYMYLTISRRASAPA
jgi:ribosomal protein S18 acetylase RimI-like enzyme